MDSLPLNLDRKLGAAFLGNLVAAILYGITCIQALKFFRKKHADDSLPFRALILFLWSLDTTQVALVTHALYYYLISSYGDISTTESAVWSIISQVFIICTSDLVIRCLFARRVWLLTNRNKYFLACIVLPSLLSFATGCAAAGRAFEIRIFESMTSISYLFYLSLAAGVVSDILIAGHLCLSLWQRRTSMNKTDSILSVFMLYTINTTLLTTLCSIASLITFAIWPEDFVYIAIYLSMSKLYLNSLLATLNHRTSVSEPFNYPTDPTTVTPFRENVPGPRKLQKPGPHFSGTQTPRSEGEEGTTDFGSSTISSEAHGLPIWHHHRRPSESFESIGRTHDSKEEDRGGRTVRERRHFVLQSFTPHSGFRFPLSRWFNGQASVLER
ncbi:hypothetical protein FPV67DRAFT_587580 [Lyophyllum atratum]|nr:hypothetical protein FPV67DRAFT_587580 [Lyophyllum atratum]